MHWVAHYGRINCINLLSQAGAVPASISDQGVRPLDSAPRANEVEICDACLVLGRGHPKIRGPVEAGGKSRLTARTGRCMSDAPIQDSLSFDKPGQQRLLVGQCLYTSTLSTAADSICQLSQPLETLATTFSVQQAQSRAGMVK